MSLGVKKEVIESDDDVVVTGLGVMSPLGLDVCTHQARLLAGESAVALFDPKEGVDGEYWLAAKIEGFDAKKHVQPRKAIKVMCREIQLAFAASMQACSHAGIAAGVSDPDRVGTVFAGEIILSDILDVEEIVRLCESQGQMDHDGWAKKAMENMYPLWMLKSLPNMAACHVGIALDARGPNNTVTTEGTSSLAAILEAIHVIQRDKADVMIVGSAASRLNPSRLLQRYENDISKSYDPAERACKPFDSQRDGTVPAEASSAIVLERRRHAVNRGATIHATLSGWASTFYSPIRDLGGGKELASWQGTEQATRTAIEQVLERSGVSPSEIDHVNAAAGGSIAGDAAEARGIASVLPGVPVVSYKGAIGDSVSAAGLVEWISSLAGMQQGEIPATTNHRATAKECPVHVVSGTPKIRQQDYFLKLSNTPTGRCTALLTHV